MAFLDVPVARYGLSAGMNSLGTLGGDQSQALDVNSLGEVAGGAQEGTGNYYPFIWLPSGSAPKYGFGSAGMNDLDVLTGGTTSHAFGINDSGQVVGASEITGGDYRAFIWANGTMTDLNDLLDPNSTWVLVRAMDINADGEISGLGTNLSSVTRGFVLTTCTDTGAGSLTGSPPELESELDEERDPYHEPDEEGEAYHEPELTPRAPLPPLCSLSMLQDFLMSLAGCLVLVRARPRAEAPRTLQSYRPP